MPFIFYVNMFKNRILNFGNVPLCNGRASRGIFIGDFCLPVCARCFAMMVSSSFFYFLCEKGKIKKMDVWKALLFFIPVGIDGILQYVFGYESTNARRIITGAIFGYGAANILFFLPQHMKKLQEKINKKLGELE